MFGRMHMQALEEFAVRNGCNRVVLTTTGMQAQACKFYTAQNFSIIHQFPLYVRAAHHQQQVVQHAVRKGLFKYEYCFLARGIIWGAIVLIPF